jgi:glycosyltransferase involved in cell wall biosynthesis
MDKSVSLIIPVKDTGQAFQTCLSHVAACSPPPLEVIIVLDGDTGQAMPEASLSNLRTVRLQEAGGPGRARNAGAKEAAGDILLFVDADVIVPENLVAKISFAFASSACPEAVFGSYDDTPLAQDTVSLYKNLLHHYVHQNSNADAFTFWTGCGAVLRNRFFELHGFCEDYRQPSVEDIEFGYRLKASGATILLDKAIQVGHLKQWSLPALLRTDFFLRAIPWSRLILRSGSMKNDMNITVSSRLSVLLSWLVVLLLSLVPLSSYFAIGAVLSLTLLLLVNRGLFLFFCRKRGPWFMARTLPLHFLYFLSSGLAFGMVWGQHLLQNLLRPSRKKTVAAG